MLSTLTSDPSTLLLLLVLSIAVITDISQQRIPNLLTFSAAGTGLLLHTYQHGWDGLAASLVGIMIGFLALLPFYLAQGMRAGDLKLMAACGAFLGFHTPLAIGFSLLVGMVLGLAVLGWRGGAKPGSAAIGSCSCCLPVRANGLINHLSLVKWLPAVFLTLLPSPADR
jgi:Flp pilus assembly protein protease CpaA